MFIDILRSAENSAKATKEIITYKADGNGIKTVKKELLSLAEVYKDNSISGLFADATEPENNGIIISPQNRFCKPLPKNFFCGNPFLYTDGSSRYSSLKERFTPLCLYPSILSITTLFAAVKMFFSATGLYSVRILISSLVFLR